MPTSSMPLGKEVTSIRKLCKVIADSTSKGEKELSATLKGITSGTNKSNTETAKTLSDASKSIQAVAKNESKLIENTDGALNLAKTLISRMSNAGDKLADINRQLQENSFVTGGKIDPDFLKDLKELSDDQIKKMGIEPSVLKKAIEAEEERQEKEKKQKEKEEKTIDKFGKAIEGFKRGIRDAKDEATSGNLSGWGFLGAVSGAVGGYTAVDEAEARKKKEEEIKAQEKAQQAENDKADDIVLGMNGNSLDNDTIVTAHGGQTLEERADTFAKNNGFEVGKGGDAGEKMYIGKDPQTGKIKMFTLEEFKELVKADAEKRFKERQKLKTNSKATSENNKENSASLTSKNEVKANGKKNVQIPKPSGVIDVKDKIGTIDTRTGNTLSNNAMNLEKTKEKSVTIVSDNSAKVSNQNTTAFPTPISVRNTDSATKYFNDTI